MVTPADPRAGAGLDRRAVGVWLGLLALLALVLLAWQARVRSSPAAPTGPWLEPPAGGMDASDWGARQWLRAAGRAGAGARLADECGHDPALPRERYAARLPGAAGGAGWRVIVDMGAGIAQVTATSDGSLRLAPDVARHARSGPVAPGAIGRDLVLPRAFPREQLEDLRRAWRAPQLWGPPLSDAEDPGAPPVVLESCVEGRYAVRLRRVSPEATKLAAALDALMAAGGVARP